MMPGWRGAFRRHEHSLALGWLALVAVLAGAVAFWPTRVAALRAVERSVRWWDDRWGRRLEQGAALLAEGRGDEAVTFLERLDRMHPATNVRHARDKERARLLRLLARAYETTGRRGRAMETYHRLVAFDSLSYYNHFVLGQAAKRLESGWAVAPEARDAFAAALRTHPAHLPSLRGVIAYYMDRGEYIPVRDAFRTYVDAHLVHPVSVALGSTVRSLSVLADGRSREYELSLPATGDPVETIEVHASGMPFVVEALVIEPAATVGGMAAPEPVELAARPRSPGGAALLPPVAVRLPRAARVARVRIRLVAFKPIDAALWSSVVRSLRNLLLDDEIPVSAARVAVFPTSEAADAILGDQPWASEGLGLGPDERLY